MNHLQSTGQFPCTPSPPLLLPSVKRPQTDSLKLWTDLVFVPALVQAPGVFPLWTSSAVAMTKTTELPPKYNFLPNCHFLTEESEVDAKGPAKVSTSEEGVKDREVALTFAQYPWTCAILAAFFLDLTSCEKPALSSPCSLHTWHRSDLYKSKRYSWTSENRFLSEKT